MQQERLVYKVFREDKVLPDLQDQLVPKVSKVSQVLLVHKVIKEQLDHKEPLGLRVAQAAKVQQVHKVRQVSMALQALRVLQVLQAERALKVL